MNINWKVAEPNTIKAYSVAARDYETVTGLPVDRADAVSISSWQASMVARGLAINTIRQRLSAVSMISGVRVQLPRRQKIESNTLSADQVRDVFRQVVDGSHRMLLMRLLTLGSRARRVTIAVHDFAAHFLGQDNECEMDAKEVSRLLKRYAKKAGLDDEVINLRTWCVSGKELMKHMSIRDVVSLAPSPIESAHVAYKPLHGMNRRSQSQSLKSA